METENNKLPEIAGKLVKAVYLEHVSVVFSVSQTRQLKTALFVKISLRNSFCFHPKSNIEVEINISIGVSSVLQEGIKGNFRTIAIRTEGLSLSDKKHGCTIKPSVGLNICCRSALVKDVT